MTIKYKLLWICFISMNISAQIDTFQLNEIVISSTKSPELSKNVASTFFILNTEKIQKINPSNSAYLLENSGNIAVQRSQAGGGSPIIRGFEANKVLINIDGIRLNNAIFRGGHLQNVLRIDNSIVDRVEVMYGPSNVNFGSDALGGVVNFYTKNPKFNTAAGNVFARYSSALNEISTHVDYNIGSNKWASLTSFSYSSFGDVMQGNVRNSKYSDFGKRNFYVERINNLDVAISNTNPNQQKLSAYQQYDLLQKICYKPSENTLHTLNFQFSNTGNVNRYDRLTETKNDLPAYSVFYYGPEKRLLAAYSLDKVYNAKVVDKSKLTVSFQNIDESRVQRKFKSNDQKHQVENVKVYGINFDLYKKFEKHNIQLGAESYFNNVHSTAFTRNIISNIVKPADTRYPNGGSSTIFAALFVQDYYSIWENRIMLNAGLRYNYNTLSSTFSDTTFFKFPFSKIEQKNSTLNGNVNVKIKVIDDTYLKLSYSRGFRTPNVDDLAKVFESTTSMLIVPNANIKSERTNNYELSLKSNFKKLNVEAGVYYTRMFNTLTLDKFTYNGSDSIEYNGNKVAVMAMQNKQNAYIKGIFGNINLQLFKHFTFSGNMSYTIGKIESENTNTPLDHIPPLFGMLKLEYNRSLFAAMAWVHFNAAKPISEYRLNAEDNEKYATIDGTPAWTTFNAALQYNIEKSTAVVLALENILDTNYRNFASGISSPGRNFRVTIKHAF